MVCLYKHDRHGLLYMECWKDKDFAVVYFGQVGQTGKKRRYRTLEGGYSLFEERFVEEMLGWHGVGYLDGFETAPTQPGKETATLDFYCLVVDAEIAARLLRESQSIDSRVTLREIRSRPF